MREIKGYEGIFQEISQNLVTKLNTFVQFYVGDKMKNAAEIDFMKNFEVNFDSVLNSNCEKNEKGSILFENIFGIALKRTYDEFMEKINRMNFNIGGVSQESNSLFIIYLTLNKNRNRINKKDN